MRLTDIQAEVLIAGAGPAGAATSLFLSKQKIHHIILDKAVFPRDKICGDALSGKVVHVLNKLDPSFVSELSTGKEFLGSYGVRFVAPNNRALEVPFSTNLAALKHPPGFISKRI
ncbi:MAG TPA: FAD-dependent monooxygenase, partial [Bacteroidia bacterium]|nr:FAD-dependent monooxygenase [Bacteroidia bacterium]